MAQEGGQGNHDGKHGNRHGEHGGNHGSGLGIQLQMHMATMTSHQNAFLEVVSLLCNTVSKLETTVLRNEADCTTRLDDLETSVKTLGEEELSEKVESKIKSFGYEMREI